MFTQVQKLQLRNEVQRVLHVPGNYTGGILEMAIIIDHCLTKEQVKETVKEIVQTLKQTDQVFRNVRLNVIDWYSDDHFEKNVKGMPMLMMDSYYEDYQQQEDGEKHLEILAAQLKKFYARSKLILLISNHNYQIEDEVMLHTEMKPFLHRKLILIEENGIERYHLT